MSFKDRLEERRKQQPNKEGRQQANTYERAIENALQKQQGRTPEPAAREGTPPGLSDKQARSIEQQKQVPESTNRAAAALNRHTQSRMAELTKNRDGKPSVEYLKQQQLQKMRQLRLDRGRDR